MTDIDMDQLAGLLAAALKPVVDQVAELTARVDGLSTNPPDRPDDGPLVELKQVGPSPLVVADQAEQAQRFGDSADWALTPTQRDTFVREGGRGLYRYFRDDCASMQHHIKVAIIQDAQFEDHDEALEISRDLLKRD